MINEKIFDTLLYAATDKEINSNEFRVLFLISTRENLTHSFFKKIGILKHSNTISETFSKLQNNQYIEKEKQKSYYKKGVSSYQYFVNTNKSLLPFNNNSLLGFSNDYFQKINELFEYFYKNLPKKKAVSVISAKKSLGLILDCDGLSVNTIKDEIDLISQDLFLKQKITSPAQLRKYLKIKKG